jgi:hypothetical protein
VRTKDVHKIWITLLFIIYIDKFFTSSKRYVAIIPRIVYGMLEKLSGLYVPSTVLKAQIHGQTCHIHAYIVTPIHAYTHKHTYHFVGLQILSYNSRTWILSEKNHITHKQNERTQYNAIKQMLILQTPKSNTVHNIIIK